MAFSLRDLKIRQQIYLVALPPLFILISAAALAFYGYVVVMRVNRSLQNSHDSLMRGEGVYRRLTEMFVGAREYVLLRGPAALAAYQEGAARIPEDLLKLREAESGNGSDVAEVQALETEIRRWQANWARPTIEKVRRESALDTVAALAEGERQMSPLRGRLVRLLEADEEENVANLETANQIIRRLLLLGLGLATLLAGVLLLFTRVVSRLIAEPVNQLIVASERVRQGDFAPSLPPAVSNELGILSRSFAQMTASLREEREEMAALTKFSEAVTQCTSEREVYEQVLHSLRERFHPRRVVIHRINAADGVLEVAAAFPAAKEGLDAWPIIEEPDSCKAIRIGRSFHVNDVTAEPLCPVMVLPPAEGSYYCAPLIAGGTIIGAVRLEAPKDFWTPERERLLQSYVGGAATALSNIRLLQTMKQQATVDSLTGLYNRRFFDEYARKLLAMARRRSQPLGVIMMDLDHFKTFNDTYGHELGDRLLRQFARTATGAARETSVAARLGGEEFAVLLPDANVEVSRMVAERIRHAVARMTLSSGTEKSLSPVTVSLGVAVYPEHGQTLEELLQAADKALYESKGAGRNRTTVYVEAVED
jgi:diguanylate cyclase (GGDEF)-like protein